MRRLFVAILLVALFGALFSLVTRAEDGAPAEQLPAEAPAGELSSEPPIDAPPDSGVGTPAEAVPDPLPEELLPSAEGSFQPSDVPVEEPAPENTTGENPPAAPESEAPLFRKYDEGAVAALQSHASTFDGATNIASVTDPSNVAGLVLERQGRGKIAWNGVVSVEGARLDDLVMIGRGWAAVDTDAFSGLDGAATTSNEESTKERSFVARVGASHRGCSSASSR